MSDAYMIEIGDQAAGLVTREERSSFFRFHAALPEAFPLDGSRFSTPDEARAAVRKLLRDGPGGKPFGPLPHAA